MTVKGIPDPPPPCRPLNVTERLPPFGSLTVAHTCGLVDAVPPFAGDGLVGWLGGTGGASQEPVEVLQTLGTVQASALEQRPHAEQVSFVQETPSEHEPPRLTVWLQKPVETLHVSLVQPLPSEQFASEV